MINPNVVEAFAVLRLHLEDCSNQLSKKIIQLTSSQQYEEIEQYIQKGKDLHLLTNELKEFEKKWWNLDISETNHKETTNEDKVLQRSTITRDDQKQKFIIETNKPETDEIMYRYSIKYNDFQDILSRLLQCKNELIKTIDVAGQHKHRYLVDRAFRILMKYELLERIEGNKTLYKIKDRTELVKWRQEFNSLLNKK